jgi:hypothetical protein
MFDTTTTSGGYATINGGSCTTLGTTGTNYISSGTTISGGLILNNNTTSMNQQVKVAVFHVKRNKHNEIKSSEWVADFWIEKKPGVSIDYAVAKMLKDAYEADEIVIKEIFTVTL